MVVYGAVVAGADETGAAEEAETAATAEEDAAAEETTTVVPTGMTEVEITVERAGQLVTSAAQLVMVTSAVL